MEGGFFLVLIKHTMGGRVAEKYPSYRMLPLKAELAKAFHESQSFKWDPIKGFTLASGQTSPFYVDCRSLMAHPESRRLVAHLAYESLQGVEFDCLGGLEIGAISIATSISDFAFVAQPTRTWRTFVVTEAGEGSWPWKTYRGIVSTRGSSRDRRRCAHKRGLASQSCGGCQGGRLDRDPCLGDRRSEGAGWAAQG